MRTSNISPSPRTSTCCSSRRRPPTPSVSSRTASPTISCRRSTSRRVRAVMIAPAMNSNMFDHPAVARNLETLIARGVHVVDPGSGYLACGWIGKGRLAEPEDVVAAAEQLLGSKTAASLAGRSLLVTAGPTFEDIDPVRFVGNRSSGRMGYALASEALRRGAAVTLVSRPDAFDRPSRRHCREGPERRRHARRGDGTRERPGRDRHVGRCCRLHAGGAGLAKGQEGGRPGDDHAEPHQGHPRRTRQVAVAQAGTSPCWSALPPKRLMSWPTRNRNCKDKAADLIVANDVSRSDAGFDVETNAVTLVTSSGAEEIPLQAKAAIAAADPRSHRTVSRRRSREERRHQGVTMSRELADHLKYYEEIGVTGVSRDAKWRQRPDAPDAPVAPVSTDPLHPSVSLRHLPLSSPWATSRPISAPRARAASCVRSVDRRSSSASAILEPA